MKIENEGWNLSFRMIVKNYKTEKKRPSKKYVTYKKENPIKIIPLDSPEHQDFLMHQTLEQFQLAKKHGWVVAKALTEVKPNFHEGYVG